MKLCFTLFLSTVLLTACSSAPKPVVLQPIGPAPQAVANRQTDGFLMVYSAWSNFVDPGSTGHHSRYWVTSDDGKIYKEVINHIDRFDEGPLRLALAPGSYHVRARSAHFGRVNLTVIIERQQTTFVYLDGAFHPEAPSADQRAAVTLPDGKIVGWSATVATTKP